MISAIIIDDIEQARKTLKEDLKVYCPEIEVIGEAEGVVSGLKLLKEKQADVLFLDIQMQDGSGFDLLEILPDLSCQVIFTTASDAFAIKAFRFSAVDYLLKPIDPDELMAAVKKVTPQNQPAKESIETLLSSFKNQYEVKNIVLHTQEKIHIAPIDSIIRCQSMVNYTTFYFADQTKLLVTRTLKEFDQMLQDYGFIRVHQSHLVNGQQIKEYIKSEGGYLVMKDGAQVPISMRKKAMVIKMLESL
ncbi:MAG: LytTR family DNA-binding domain-containing protein [Bacteroidota bacterium]